ncbi:hypothetical protein [Nonomuraea roseoviolacea]|uniref:Uncharacterized protein n=1 Tax=Nonomuraea roseoviolacea subsp. carminata TaxID=160689 RepID=A0ABT1K9H6_9ACTN|nr:hypothetical protein [Nonomuraea roseoviolacea]MCP2350671.1 hypothetical protein [Nonomuraea roseoviolacea subsp. carminata]
MNIPKCGEKANITIKGVRIVNHPSSVFVRIADEHGDVYAMPPQAAITHASGQEPTDADLQERVAAALAALDGMEAEGYIQPYVAATVRKKLGIPPRHWPPQPGDVWDDGLPSGFFSPLWFAQVIHEAKCSHLVMVPMERGSENTDVKTPEELLVSTSELTLVHRHKDGGR